MTSSERVTVEFDPSGSLTYTIHEDGKDKKILLHFRTEDGVIVTDQPSAPREDKTAYRINEQGKLVMDYGGETSTFVRT